MTKRTFEGIQIR